MEKNERQHPLIVVYGEPYSSRYKIIQVSDLLDDPNDWSEQAAVKAIDKLNLLLEKEGIVVVFKKFKESIRGHIGSELLNKADVSISVENERYASPELHNVDVEKVIEDLLHVIINRDTATQTISIGHAIQNAEAALGMLQAFKERGHIGTHLKNVSDTEIKIPPLIDGRPQRIPETLTLKSECLEKIFDLRKVVQEWQHKDETRLDLQHRILEYVRRLTNYLMDTRCIHEWTPEQVAQAMASQPTHFKYSGLTKMGREVLVNNLTKSMHGDHESASAIISAIETVLQTKGL